jgi:uncharacterized membrane protein
MRSKIYSLKGGGIQNYIRADYSSTNSKIYFSILTIILIMTLSYSFTKMSEFDADRRTKILFTTILISVYAIFIGCYYLNWSLESIFLIILVLSTLFGIISFLVIYFGNDACAYIEKTPGVSVENIEIKILLIALLIMVIYLGIYNRDMYTIWTTNDTIRFIVMLIILRVIYYIVEKYNLSYYKTATDIIITVMLYFNGFRMYKILNLPTEVPIKLA